MIVVSHDLHALSLMCDRVMWLEHGRMRKDRTQAAEVIAAYTNEVMQHAQLRAA